MAKKNIDKEYQKEIEKSIKMFDVAKPGSSRPASTSRPVIVGHSNTVTNDPMVTKDASNDSAPAIIEVKKKKSTPLNKPKKTVIVKHATEPEVEPQAGPVVEEITTENKPLEPPSHRVKKIEPIVHEDAQVEEEIPTKDEQSDEPKTAESVSDEEEKAEVAEAAVSADVSSEEPPKNGVVDTLVDQVADKKQEDKELADVAIRLEEAQKSIDSREFYLPITTSEQKRNTRVMVIILLVVIIVGAIGFFGYTKGYSGLDLFNKKANDVAEVAPVAKPAAAKQATAQQKTVGVSLNYPSSWKATLTPEGQYDDKGLASIVLLAPVEKISVTETFLQKPGQKSVSLPAQMRLRVFRAKDAASITKIETVPKIASATCQKQEITIAGHQGFLATLTYSFAADPSIQLVVGTNNCAKTTTGRFTVPRFNQLQGLQNNTWIQVDYQLTKEAYETIGDPSAIENAANYSPTVSPEAFTNATDKQALAIISTIKQYGN